MKKTPLIVSGLAAVLVAGGSGTAFAMTHEVDVTVDGKSSTTRVLSGTVGDVLASQGVSVAPTDIVTPAVSTPIQGSTTISVVAQRPVTVTIDGVSTTRLTTATTVGGALAGFEFEAEGAQVSPAPSTELSDDGTSISVATTKTVTFTGQRGQASFTGTGATVGDFASTFLGDYQPTDRFFDAAGTEVPASTRATDGMSVRIQRVRVQDATTTQEIPFTSSTTEDPEAPAGTKKVTTKGEPGTKEVMIRTTTVDGVETERATLGEKVTREPVDEVVAKGTKKADPAPAAAASSDSSSGSSSSSDSSSQDSTDQGGEGSGAVTTCKASFYGDGDGTDGGPTASGERFNASAMTAAHKSLPLGTRIRVTNPANGKSVVVRINDRGPYIGGRCLDLSAGAFGAIGNKGSGTMTVSFQKVG